MTVRIFYPATPAGPTGPLRPLMHSAGSQPDQYTIAEYFFLQVKRATMAAFEIFCPKSF